MEKETRPDMLETALCWHDARALTIEGKGWQDTASFYERLPVKARDIVNEKHWKHAQCPAGMTVRFSTNSPALFARWDGLAEQPETSAGGLDLYVRHAGQWRWLGYTTGHKPLFEHLPVQYRDYLLYLPLFYPVQRVELGLPDGFEIKATEPRSHAPVVFYGTSITNGSRASRAGMAYVAILGRWLDTPVLNLGFSGNGDMDPRFIDLLCELDPSVYVLDCLPNMTAARVAERAEPAVRKLRAAHVATPIVLVEMFYCDAFLKPHRQERCDASNKAQHAAYGKLVRSGIQGLHYVRGEGLIGTDGEATIDGTHYTDLGFMRCAERLYQTLRPMTDTPGQA